MQRQQFPVPGAPPGTIELSSAALAHVRAIIANRRAEGRIDPVVGFDWLDSNEPGLCLTIGVWDRPSLRPRLIDEADGIAFVFTALDWRRYVGKTLDIVSGKLAFVTGES